MAKRNKLGTGDRIPDLDAKGNQKTDENGEGKLTTDGYKNHRLVQRVFEPHETRQGINWTPSSVSLHSDMNDHLFLLTKSGMNDSHSHRSDQSDGKSAALARDGTETKKKAVSSTRSSFSSRVSASLLDAEDEEELNEVDGEEEWRAFSPKRRIQTGRRVLKRAGGLHLGGEFDGRAFFDLRLEHG